MEAGLLALVVVTLLVLTRSALLSRQSVVLVVRFVVPKILNAAPGRIALQLLAVALPCLTLFVDGLTIVVSSIELFKGLQVFAQ